MRSLDLLLFTWLGAGQQPNLSVLWAALHASTVSAWLIVALLLALAVRDRTNRVDVTVSIALAGAVGFLAHAIANALNTPRPFVAGLSPDFAMHSGRGGFPSTHASVMFAVAAYMLCRPAMRVAGVLVGALALVTGLARIYLGIHFPLDVLGGLVLGAASGCLSAAIARRLRLGRPPAAVPKAEPH